MASLNQGEALAGELAFATASVGLSGFLCCFLIILFAVV